MKFTNIFLINVFFKLVRKIFESDLFKMYLHVPRQTSKHGTGPIGAISKVDICSTLQQRLDNVLARHGARAHEWRHPTRIWYVDIGLGPTVRLRCRIVFNLNSKMLIFNFHFNNLELY